MTEFNPGRPCPQQVRGAYLSDIRERNHQSYFQDHGSTLTTQSADTVAGSGRGVVRGQLQAGAGERGRSCRSLDGHHHFDGDYYTTVFGHNLPFPVDQRTATMPQNLPFPYFWWRLDCRLGLLIPTLFEILHRTGLVRIALVSKLHGIAVQTLNLAKTFPIPS